MATINFLKRKDSKNSGALGSVIAYCIQRYKTEIENTSVRLISGVDCIAERAFKDFMDTKKQFNKVDGVQFYYAIQSFEEETNIDPVLAHQIAIEWVEECYPRFQALVCTHMDTDNIHSHIIINSVNSLDGHKIHQNKNDIERVRYVNDQLCMKYGLPVCEPKKKVQGVTSKEYYAAMAGNSWKTQLAIDIDNAMLYAKSKIDFMMTEIMEDQATELQSYIQELEETAESFNTEVTSQTNEIENKARKAMKEISSQAGRMSENFSNSLSMEKEYMKDMFLRQRIGSWILTAMQILSLGAFVLWVISQTF